MPSISKSLHLAVVTALALAGLAAGPMMGLAPANAGDRQFFERVAGEWKGPGEIVAGKYKGTKFVCNLTGDTSGPHEAGITLDGSCRVGIFTQEMSAVISRRKGSYTGRFLDGADGEGLDVVSGRVSGNRVVVGINRKKLNGAMIAQLNDPETLNVTISVKVGKQLVPVIGMTLKRDLEEIASDTSR